MENHLSLLRMHWDHEPGCPGSAGILPARCRRSRGFMENELAPKNGNNKTNAVEWDGHEPNRLACMMQCSVILAHPAPASFNHAIARTAVARLSGAGHAVVFHDLYAENFDPIMEAAELPKEAILPPEIERHCEEIGQADGIIIVHPNWWSQPPAILKGWVDRALRPGRAYNFVTSETGEGKPVGLLRAKGALVITTANTPQEKEVELFGDPLATFWQKCVFGLCGVANFHRLVFSPVIVSSNEQRRQWLLEVEAAVERIFPSHPA